ncbi:hypothetical protein CAPTEDRAFT_194377 [Capitella teleta]|uniref:Uncharacterized protein n=1 Tax=Capitella teleta TaxID=283909 RepID=R7V4W9_CAPTE|nr:hypothetical protein CAPTEDRAFT_194377 [Capitella teleta]|eukprot:ELU11406.1 hypothetical protein CAPTEDRAFT_194377 [Capitella teleta]
MTMASRTVVISAVLVITRLFLCWLAKLLQCLGVKQFHINITIAHLYEFFSMDLTHLTNLPGENGALINRRAIIRAKGLALESLPQPEKKKKNTVKTQRNLMKTPHSHMLITTPTKDALKEGPPRSLPKVS